MTRVVPWPVEALREQLAPLLPGLAVEVVAEIDSTNTELMRRVRTGRADPVLLVAERQTAGRGRLGRRWLGAPDESLTFSLGLALAPGDWSGLSLAVGVALAEALDPRIGLKWPNDLWWDGRKLGGVLVETAGLESGRTGPRYAVLGVGINLAPRAPEGLSTPPAALRELWPGAQAGEVLLGVARPLVQALQLFDAQGFAPFEGRFAARDLLRDRAVVLSDGRAGTARGVNGQGALLVHTAAGMLTVTSSEVSVRPGPGA